MRDLLLLAIHLFVTVAKLLRPGGARAVAAESLLLKQQLIVSNRSRRRAPNLTSLARFVLGLISLFIRPQRIPQLSAILKPTTLFKHYQPDPDGSDGPSWLTLIAQAKDTRTTRRRIVTCTHIA